MPLPSTSDLPLNIPCFHNPLPLLHASSRFHDITWGRSIAGCYVAQWSGLTGCCIIWGYDIALRYPVRGCGTDGRYIVWGYEVAPYYIARGFGVARCYTVAGAQGYDTIGIAQ